MLQILESVVGTKQLNSDNQNEPGKTYKAAVEKELEQ